MYGAILGDIIGSPYEFDQVEKTKDFPLFAKDSTFTDDSVMTLAVAEALMNTVEACGRHFAQTDGTGLTDEVVKENVVYAMQKYGARYPDAGYGARFSQWLREKDPRPYGSFGNGSAMRVSSAAWLFDALDDFFFLTAFGRNGDHIAQEFRHVVAVFFGSLNNFRIHKVSFLS